MKKFYIILAAIAALAINVQAQETGTINVGDWENASYPSEQASSSTAVFGPDKAAKTLSNARNAFAIRLCSIKLNAIWKQPKSAF